MSDVQNQKSDGNAVTLGFGNTWQAIDAHANQRAYDAFVKANPDAYADGDWVVWQHGKQIMHVPIKTHPEASFSSIIESVKGHYFCIRHVKVSQSSVLQSAAPSASASSAPFASSTAAPSYLDWKTISKQLTEQADVVARLTSQKESISKQLMEAMAIRKAKRYAYIESFRQSLISRNPGLVPRAKKMVLAVRSQIHLAAGAKGEPVKILQAARCSECKCNDESVTVVFFFTHWDNSGHGPYYGTHGWHNILEELESCCYPRSFALEDPLCRMCAAVVLDLAFAEVGYSYFDNTCALAFHEPKCTMKSHSNKCHCSFLGLQDVFELEFEREIATTSAASDFKPRTE